MIILQGVTFPLFIEGMELSGTHKEYLMNTYLQLRELRACILEFLEAYKRKK